MAGLGNSSLYNRERQLAIFHHTLARGHRATMPYEPPLCLPTRISIFVCATLGAHLRSLRPVAKIQIDSSRTTLDYAIANRFQAELFLFCSSSFATVFGAAIFVSGRGEDSTIGGTGNSFALPAPNPSNRRAWLNTWLSKLPTIWL